MRKKGNINFSSKKNKKQETKKKILIVAISLIATFVAIKGVGAVSSYIKEQNKIKIEKQKKEEEERKIEEQKRKEEEERKKMMIGVNAEGKKYAYDAVKVSKKLSSYDYSNNGEKIVFLTFDDGTSTTVTPEVLRILDEQDVKATFFLTGANIERGKDKAKELIKEEFNSGHAIANHSFTHDYKMLYPNRTLDLEAFNADFKKTDELLKDVLGPYFSTRVIRCPGGHMSWKGMDKLDTYLEENNMASIDWNALNGDAEGKKKNAQELVNKVIESSKNKEMVVVLMHDTYGKEETAKALPQIIQYFKDNGYAFKTLA